MRSILLLGCVASLLACSTKKIPGTDIDDNSDTRAVLDVMTKYRSAVETRNPQALVELADESFRDDGGSATPDDDLDYRSLHTALPSRMLRFEDIRLDLNVRRVEFDETRSTVKVTYTYSMSFRMPQLTSRTQTETDIKQMFMKHGGGGWKIISGI